MPNGNPNGLDHRDDDERHFDQVGRDDDTEHHGGGQSGYGAGRLGSDRTMGPAYRNQVSANDSYDDRQGVRIDERFTGRGGEGYWIDRPEPAAGESNEARDPDMGALAGNVGQPLAGGHRGKGPVGYKRTDDRINESVCEALADDDHVDATHIEVVVKNGEVMLTGVVDDRRMKRRTEELVERLPGVKVVQNQLRYESNQSAGISVEGSETETSDNSHA